MSKLNLLKEYCKEENLDFDEVIKKLKNITTKYEEKKKQHDPLTDPKNKRNSILKYLTKKQNIGNYIWKFCSLSF